MKPMTEINKSINDLDIKFKHNMKIKIKININRIFKDIFKSNFE